MKCHRHTYHNAITIGSKRLQVNWMIVIKTYNSHTSYRHTWSPYSLREPYWAFRVKFCPLTYVFFFPKNHTNESDSILNWEHFFQFLSPKIVIKMTRANGGEHFSCHTCDLCNLFLIGNSDIDSERNNNKRCRYSREKKSSSKMNGIMVFIIAEFSLMSLSYIIYQRCSLNTK